MLKIIISPAKKMNLIDEFDCSPTKPGFLKESTRLLNVLKGMSREELKKLWQCSDKLTLQNYSRLKELSFEKAVSPALLAYEGIQFQYIAPRIFSDAQWRYVSEHLRILSGFYGILKPTDAVMPYRLEMQAKLITEQAEDLYRFWGDKLYASLIPGSGSLQILNLASSEYSKVILPYIKPPVTCVTCIFGEIIDGRVKMKGTQAKIARGEMVRWLAAGQIENVEDIRSFSGLGYRFQAERSSKTEYVFIK